MDPKEMAKAEAMKIIVSPHFALVYHGERAARRAELHLHGIDMNWRKRKKLINAARRKGREHWRALSQALER